MNFRRVCDDQLVDLIMLIFRIYIFCKLEKIISNPKSSPPLSSNFLLTGGPQFKTFCLNRKVGFRLLDKCTLLEFAKYWQSLKKHFLINNAIEIIFPVFPKYLFETFFPKLTSIIVKLDVEVTKV